MLTSPSRCGMWPIDRWATKCPTCNRRRASRLSVPLRSGVSACLSATAPSRARCNQPPLQCRQGVPRTAAPSPRSSGRRPASRFLPPASPPGLASTPRVPNFYARHGNPSVRAFEDAVAELEGAEGALAFASGMGAISAVVLGLCGRGSHIVAQRQMYGGTLQLLGLGLSPFRNRRDPGGCHGARRVRRRGRARPHDPGVGRVSRQPEARSGRPR